MSEGLPETPTAAARVYLAGLSLALIFRGVDTFKPETNSSAVLCFVLAAGIAVVDLRLTWFITKLGPRFGRTLNMVATDARWWVGTTLFFIAITSFSPIFEKILGEQNHLSLEKPKAQPAYLCVANCGYDGYEGKPLGLVWSAGSLSITAGDPVEITGFTVPARNFGPTEIKIKKAYAVSGVNAATTSLMVSTNGGMQIANWAFSPIDRINDIPVDADFRFGTDFRAGSEGNT